MIVKEDIRIMIVEDDKLVRNLIVSTLKVNGYKYLIATTGKAAIMETMSHRPDILLVDLGLPDLDGLEVIRNIRSWSMCPIIVISARSEDKDKIEALDAGADDYLTKPFSVEELLARLRSTIRRLKYLEAHEDKEEPIFENGQIRIDYSSATVTVNGKEIHLMPIEYNLLCLLAQNIGKVLTHTYIMDKVWKNSIDNDLSSLRVYMASLRKKIETDCERGTYIQTHIGIGYRMVKVEGIQTRKSTDK